MDEAQAHIDSVKRRQKERHTNQLPTKEIEQAYAGKMAAAMEEASRALASAAKTMRDTPEYMLRNAFSPNIIGMHPLAAAVIEVAVFEPYVGEAASITSEIRGRAIVGEHRHNEVGFRAIVRSNGTIAPAQDNRMG